MSDDLVKRAREWNFCWPSHEVEVLVPEMADRIEQLVATCELLEAKLAKAVEALESVISCSNDVRLVHDAEATLTELKGEKDE